MRVILVVVVEPGAELGGGVVELGLAPRVDVGARTLRNALASEPACTGTRGDLCFGRGARRMLRIVPLCLVALQTAACSHADCPSGCVEKQVATFDLSCGPTDLASVALTGPCST